MTNGMFHFMVKQFRSGTKLICEAKSKQMNNEKTTTFIAEK